MLQEGMSDTLSRPPARMTVAEFLEWDSGDASGQRWQLVNGEPVRMALNTMNHGTMVAEAGALLANHLVAQASPCRTIICPGIIPRVQAAENWRIPDLGVTCAPAIGSWETRDPVLLVDILSPNNYREIRANVFAYTTVPSVREILVVYITRVEAELLRRLPDGSWPAQPLLVRDGETLTLDSIGLNLPLRALYRTTSLAA